MSAMAREQMEHTQHLRRLIEDVIVTHRLRIPD